MNHNKRSDQGLETYRQGLNEYSDMVNLYITLFLDKNNRCIIKL